MEKLSFLYRLGPNYFRDSEEISKVTKKKKLFCQTSIPIATAVWGKTFYRYAFALEIL